MSQCAAILNPGLTDQVLLYYLTENEQIALEHRPIDGAQHAKYTDNGTLPGYVVTPGSLCVALRQGVPYVYGFTKPKDEQTAPAAPAAGGSGGEKPPTGKISIISKVSPLYNPVTASLSTPTSKTTSTLPGLAACSDGKAIDYVYFLNVHTDEDGNTFKKIFQATITAGSDDPNVGALEKCPVVYGQSKLAAVTLQGVMGRLVFFQDLGTTSKKEIHYINPGLDGEPHNVPDTDTANHGTSIAVTYIGNSAGHTLFLYWLSKTHDLMRSIGTYEAVSKTWAWKPSETMTGAGYVEQEGAIAAVCDGNHNHVFYRKSGGKEFSSFKDDLANIKI
ncbi:hypothetical protein TWF569_001386 [Orbilia oligospora]|uniref:Fucose-specific lectin n=1 Tax=Orbilia oligospora TaxID=2813651 RepID=A0A7C8JQB4_ORBOL|nr:hypothetical protein TWF102_000583 [Orbilia oligospora]KAF3083909.1 hypothetical protein TWF706_001056 [Orbilia oligospora]KAF3117425.1 hypothetical protein TWF103_006169 [Orbilia oligospora]KAF3121147.1 hypothetical protein TWF594_003422 [Orbilia oligospora]KAF3133902.1 hypothetical protein TWF703_006616 [Orbilia oligospora]